MKPVNDPSAKKDDTREFIGARELAERWKMSRSGAVRIVEAAAFASFHLGKGRRATRRFLLEDVLRYEETCRTNQV